MSRRRALLPGLLALLVPSLEAQDLYDETIVRELHLTFHQPDYWQQMLDLYRDQIYIEADLAVDGVTYPDVGVRMKGNSSFNVGTSLKKPFKIKMDEFVPGQELYGFDDIRLNNGYGDPTFVREPVMTNLIRDFMPAPRANFVKLFINGESWGVYVNAEDQDKRFLEKWFPAGGGNRFKKDAPGSALLDLGTTDPMVWEMNHYSLENGVVPDAWTDLFDLSTLLTHEPLETLVAAARPILNIDGALWHVAADNVFCNLDSLLGSGNNFYVYREPYHDEYQVLINDLNMTFGVFNDGQDYSTLWSLPLNYGSNSADSPLLSRLLIQPEVSKELLAHIRVLRDALFDWNGVIQPKVAQYQALIAADVAADTKKLYPTEQFTANLTKGYLEPGKFYAPALQTFVEDRAGFLQAAPMLAGAQVELANVQSLPAAPHEGDPITITAEVTGLQSASSVTLRWRQVGAFAELPMLDDGSSGDGAAGDGVYGAQLPALGVSVSPVEYFVLARSAADGTVTFDPPKASHEPYSFEIEPEPFSTPVRINEAMAKNDSTATDELGQFEDWVELVNPSAAPVDVGGLFLSDDPALPGKWQIPANTVIGAGNVLLIWCDEDLVDGPLHANFKLSADGESVLLVAPNGVQVLDSLTFGPQPSDVSVGRLFDDGLGALYSFDFPTPEDLNSSGACGWRPFSHPTPSNHPIQLSISGPTNVGDIVTWNWSGAPPSSGLAFFVGFGPNFVPINGGPTALLMNIAFSIGLVSDGFGGGTLPLFIENVPGIAGLPFYLQTATVVGPGQFLASNALEVIFCP